MTHEFSADPIKLRIVDIKTGKWDESLVFVGDVPNDVHQHLNKVERNINFNSSVLKKFYGPGWRDRLGINIKKTGGACGRICNGNPNSNESDNIADLEQEENNEEASEDIMGNNENITDLITGDNDMFDASIMKELGDLDAEGIVDINAKSSDAPVHSDIEQGVMENTVESAVQPTIDFLATKEKTVEIKRTGGVRFIYSVPVYPVDKIMTFKDKINIVTNIPIYRQHLWFKYKGKSYPASYSMNLHKNIENIDIERLIAFYNSDQTKKKDKSIHSSIEGIPVEMEYYKNKDFMRITALDTFNLLQTYFYKYGVTEYFLVDLNDLINPTELYGKLSKDKYQQELVYYGFIALYFPMITFAVFADWLKNEKTFSQIYPELAPSRRLLTEKYDLESKITNEAYENVDDKVVSKKLFSSITQTIVSIDNYNQDVEMLLSLRNLFDIIELNEYVTYCKAFVLYRNQSIVLKKSYLNEKEPKDIIPLNSLLIKIKINTDTNENMRVVIFKNGNYIIKTDWREENHMDFKTIINVVSEKVNPIITMINKMGDRIKFFDIPLVHLSKSNALFTETSLAFYYDDDVTETRFNLFKSILEDYRTAGIVIPKDNVTLGYEYFFRKGMYKYDPARIEKAIMIDNYYEYLSNGIVKQKWETLFEKTRLFQILNVSSKLKITIAGIRNDTEMEIFHMFLTGLLKIYSTNASKIKIVGDETVLAKSKKSLKNLKVQDPLLYDFKKIYKSNVVYSKICQKPYQPLILSDDEYKKLPSTKKSAAVRYWNFTKQKPVWYSCPNMRFPYIKFIVKQHPRDFCIPCCKKIEMNENVNKKKQEMHSSCMKEHIYSGEKVNLTKGSHYIASYGKNIEVGRISRLPEHTLEPLFFDTYSPEGGIDQECVTADGYYLFGVDQNTVAINGLGYLYCLIHSLGMSMKEFLTDCASRIRKAPDKFRVLLDGNAGLYFTSSHDLADVIPMMDSDDFMMENKYETLPWNMLFMSIGYYFYGVNTIMFDDQHKESIELILPKGLRNPNEMFPDSHKNLVILRHKEKYYPIYLFNTEIFKRTGIIDNKLFLNESGLIAIIKAVVRRSFDGKSAERIKSHIDLSTIKEFANDSDITILQYYINYSNLCYAVILKHNGNTTYLPVVASHYPLEKNINLVFEPYKGEHDSKFETLNKILTLFHKWNAIKSKEAGLEGLLLYPDIKIEQWFKIAKSSEIIGFISGNINYFIKPMSEKEAKSTEDKPIQTLLYHPYEINSMLYSVKKGTLSITEHLANNSKLQVSLYEYHLYHLVMLHFIHLFNAQRNQPLRRKLITVLSKTDFNKNIDDLRDFIIDIKDVEDISKLKNIISRYMTIHHDKKQLATDITNTYFNFDKVALETIKRMPVKKINEHLHKLSKQFITIGTIKTKSFKFPNMYVACGSAKAAKEDIGYCSGNKLVIEKKRLDDILDILAHDIANPSKWKWLFNPVFVEKSVDFFKFIRRKPEYITIEFL